MNVAGVPWTTSPLGWVRRDAFQSPSWSAWDSDTRTLPRYLQNARRQYRDFAQTVIAPRALAADVGVAPADLRDLFRLAAAQGFQTELLPWPWGTMPRGGTMAPWWPVVLKAEEFAAACGGLGGALVVHDVGLMPLLMAGSWPAFQGCRRVYGEIRRGEPSLATLAVSEPGAGSDLLRVDGEGTARLSCRFRRVWGGFRLSGRKCFVPHGSVARWMTIFAAETGRSLESWTCFLLDRSMPGLAVGRRNITLGQRAADIADVVLEDVFVPERRVVGVLGQGQTISDAVHNVARPVTAAIALGIARGAFEHARQFCATTSVSGRPLESYQQVQLALADMAITLDAMRATLWQVARRPLPWNGAGLGVKVFCSEGSWQVCQTAMELLGNQGYLHCQGVEKAVRDARLTLVAAGTNEIDRLRMFETRLSGGHAQPAAGDEGTVEGPS